LPAAAASVAICAWVPGGVQMSTTSTSSRLISSRQSVTVSGTPYARAAAATAPASRPDITVTTGVTGRPRSSGATR
jgi:hypothetical protein